MKGFAVGFSSGQARVAFACAVAGFVCASQWYLYDASHQQAERFAYYLLTCGYLCGVLAPLAFWLGQRRPINAAMWKQAVPVHMAASLVLTGIGVLLEATLSWLPRSAGWAYSDAVWHYFRYQTQISVVLYWLLLCGFQIYQMYDQTRQRELQAAQLEAQLTEAQLTVLRAQLQPHFLFNTLQAATVLVYRDPHAAEEVLLSLSELLRISFQTLAKQAGPLRAEIEFLKHYTAIQQRRFGDRLRFDFQIDERLESCAVPSLLLQPLVENAIQHGIGAHRQADVVTVSAQVRQNRLHIEVKNEASVLDDTVDRLLARGVGMTNTMARLERLYGKEQSFDIRNLEPRGVAVSLSIPLRMLPVKVADLATQEVGG